MKALRASITILLDPRVIGPEAPTEWSGSQAEVSACDYISELLSDAQRDTVLDWAYQPIDRDRKWGWELIEIDPHEYEEGSAV